MLVACRVDPGFKAIDYDPKPLKVALRKAGNEVRKLARKKISRRAVSEAGQFPGRQTGNMPVYYPAFVVYGHRGPGTETADQARKHKARGGVKVAAPRKNFIPEAAQEKSKALQDQIFDALGDAIK